ncbi:hypothetical protein PHJA_000425100 [Phtheirospermum japonicum]|uniref:Uncharacterized protein n=1 Tax=Phtheirospermum japonicum TaxID=374723 RepID=A0A830B5B6_9LAMI|nr:hypothetical protein PHJA_000425100 [Phtheirospermum japonicum]
MLQLHKSQHFHLTHIAMINGLSRHDILLNSQKYAAPCPQGQRTHRYLGCAMGSYGEVGIGEHSSWLNSLLVIS